MRIWVPIIWLSVMIKNHDLDSITLWGDELQELASKIGKYDYYLEQKAAISRVLASKKMNEKAALWQKKF